MKTRESLFRKILVATDFSEHAGAALGRALALAEKTGAEITVVHVLADVADAVPGTAFEAPWTMHPEELQRAEKKLRRQALEHLDAWLTPHLRPDHKLRTEVRVGVPFVELIRAALKGKHDLLLAGTQGRSTLGRLFVGSTAERLVRKCPCPVWIVKPEHEWPLTSILAPVDLSPVSIKSVRLADRLARLSNCPLTVLHVFNVAAEQPIPRPPGTASLDLSTMRREVRRAAAQQLHDFVHAHTADPARVQQQLGLGVPWKVIDRTARKLDAGLIVMGSVGRTGIPGFLIGNTAEKVLRHCDCSILAVKPDGFVSPVTLS
ncbi:MAG: universal stress protein [Planctomycetia bacterium]|nr:universal stress protein [Planctomycetia bacterium]